MVQPLWQKIGDREYLLGENRIQILEDSIVYVEVVGEQTDEHAELIRKNVHIIAQSLPGKMRQLINLNNSGKSSPKCRELFKQLNEENISDRVAVFGMHPVARVLAIFVTGVTQQKHVRFFTNKEEALNWLRQCD